MKIYFYDAGHMTKIAIMPIYGNNTINPSFPEPLGNLDETLYVASETQAHQSLFI